MPGVMEGQLLGLLLLILIFEVHEILPRVCEYLDGRLNALRYWCRLFDWLDEICTCLFVSFLIHNVVQLRLKIVTLTLFIHWQFHVRDNALKTVRSHFPLASVHSCDALTGYWGYYPVMVIMNLASLSRILSAPITEVVSCTDSIISYFSCVC